MKNHDKDLIRSILSKLPPEATESEKRTAIKAECPYSISAIAHQAWTKAVNSVLSEQPKAIKAAKGSLYEDWIKNQTNK